MKDGIVNMILDHNIATGTKWGFEPTNSYGVEDTLYSLRRLTNNAGWTTTVQGNFATHDYYSSGRTINYAVNGYKARLITAQEVAYITGNDSWSGSSYFYFGSLNTNEYSKQTTEQKAKQRSYYWLFDNLYNCSNSGCTNNSTSPTSGNYGYWTSTDRVLSYLNAWEVSNAGGISYERSDSTSYGVRPVITVNASEIFS